MNTTITIWALHAWQLQMAPCSETYFWIGAFTLTINQDSSDVKNCHNALHHIIPLKPFLFLFNLHNDMMDDNNGNTDTVQLSTPISSDEEIGDKDENNSA
eukprot:1564987-Ditylum_brightwellii.AAC.1